MTLSSYQIFVSFFVFILGTIFGSFGNVIIARLPAGESIVTPRSRCPQCKKPIAWYDNIPILAYIFLGGKCRRCKNKISFRYPTVEFLSGLLFLGIYVKYNFTVTTIELMIFTWAGLVASFIDYDHRILPDVFTLTGIVVGLVGAYFNPERSLTEALIGVLGGGGFLWLVAYIYSAIRHEEGMGGGDIKLIAWIGAVLGWKAVIFSILVSSITGSLVGVGFALVKKSGLKTAIPFGPFLYFAALVFIFAGAPMMKTYLSVFFPFVD